MTANSDVEEQIDAYIGHSGRVPRFTRDDERCAAVAIERGEEAKRRRAEGRPAEEDDRVISEARAAKDRFIRSYLRLVVGIARRYPLSSGMEFFDLVQEGTLGLEQAVMKFDWRRGFRFSTYATWWIRQAIGRSIANRSGLVRLPVRQHYDLRYALNQAGGDPAALSREHARLHQVTNLVSLDAAVTNGGLSLASTVPSDDAGPDHEILTQAASDMIADLLRVLPLRQRHIVEQRVGLCDGYLPRTSADVAREIGVTRQRVDQIFREAITALRSAAADLDLDKEMLAAA